MLGFTDDGILQQVSAVFIPHCHTDGSTCGASVSGADDRWYLPETRFSEKAAIVFFDGTTMAWRSLALFINYPRKTPPNSQ